MSRYTDWTDAELLEEADERELNTVESGMLDSMMKFADYDKKAHTTRHGLTHKQREWLMQLLASTRKAQD